MRGPHEADDRARATIDVAGSLIVVTGPPGAGKSAVAKLLADRYESSVLVEGDLFFAFLGRGAIPPWLPESDVQNEVVTRAAASATGRFVSGGYTTVYDGVVGPWFLATFANAAGLDHFDYVILLPPVEQCVGRVRTRRGHGFTDEGATRKMHHEFAAARIDQQHVLVDPPDHPEKVADQVMVARRAGTLVWSSGTG